MLHWRLPARLGDHMTSRRWCFTLNNYTPDELETLRKIAETSPKIECIAWGFETGENGTPHLQGIIKSKSIRMSGLKKIPGMARMHFEKMGGTWQQGKVYIGKGEQPKSEWDELAGVGPNYGLNAVVELYGTEPKGRGKRSDLEIAIADIDLSEKEFAELHPVIFIKYHRGIRELKRLKLPDRDWEMEVHVYYGPPGTGKTRAANDFGDTFFVATPRSGSEVWFDGYNGQDTMILDDFYGWLKWSFFLKLLDRYQLNLPIKGGFTPMRSHRLVITSNSSPRKWYKYDENMVFWAFERRVTKFVYYGLQGQVEGLQ